MNKMVNNLDIQGIETGNPFLRIGNLFYKGQFDQCLGTDLIFSSAAHDDNKPKRKAGRQMMPSFCTIHRRFHVPKRCSAGAVAIFNGSEQTGNRDESGRLFHQKAEDVAGCARTKD